MRTLLAADRFLVRIYNAVMSSRIGYALLGRTIPALVFALVLTVKAQTLLQFVVIGVGDRVGLAIVTYYGHVAYQSLSLVFLATICLLFVVRQPIVRGLTRLPDAIVALAGTFITTPLFFSPLTFPQLPLLVVADSLMVVGTALALLTLLHLGRCFGISPQARGLITTGPYRLVRHPLYVAEEITIFGILLPVLAPLTVLLFLAHAALQFRRALSEEAVLHATFPDYASYKRTVPPFVPKLY